MTDPSPRAGFTVGSLAEVERSLLPLLAPRTLHVPDSRGLSHLFSSSTLPHVPDFLPRRVRSILSLVIYPSSLGVLIPIYRSFCYLSFCVFFFYNAQGQWPRRGYLRKPLRRREQFFALKTTLNSSLFMYFTKCICFMNVYRKNGVITEIIDSDNIKSKKLGISSIRIVSSKLDDMIVSIMSNTSCNKSRTRTLISKNCTNYIFMQSV